MRKQKNSSRDGGSTIRSANSSCPRKEQIVNEDPRIRRLQFRAWHRGIKEADLAVGGFFDRYHGEWGEAELGWFERFIEEQDADIMAWALGTLPLPEEWRGPMWDRFVKMDFVEIGRK
jgi:antitoxin CptB